MTLSPDIRRLETLWSCLVSTAEASVALKTARDLLLCADGNTLGASVLFLLHEGAEEITRELGQAILAAGHAPDAPPDVVYFVELLEARLRKTVTVPPDETPPARDQDDTSC